MVFQVWHFRNSLIFSTDSIFLIRFSAAVYIFPEKFCHHRDNSNFKLLRGWSSDSLNSMTYIISKF